MTTLQESYGSNLRNTSSTCTLFLLAIFLHQSNIIFGINISFADIFSIILLIIIVGKGKFYIPVSPLIFFLCIAIIVLITAVYYVPSKFMVNPSSLNIISDFIKLIATILYFLIGFNLSKSNQIEFTIKWYSIFGLVLGAVGILLTTLNINILSNIFFYGEIRYRGLMNDPNYYSLLQITAFVYFSRLKDIKSQYKVLALLTTGLAVVVSGSKTGIITLIGYLCLRFIEYIFLSRKKRINVFFQTLSIMVVLTIALLSLNFFQSSVQNLAHHIPAFSRIQYLFIDFNGAITGHGSERGDAWLTALNLIEQSPLLGIGVGTYRSLAIHLFQTGDIAHNTFLQLAAEWGIPMAISFFIFLFFVLSKNIFGNSNVSSTGLILNDIMIILLIGSVAISLNNSRLLWLVLGALVAIIYQRKTKSVFTKKEVAEN